MSLTIIMSGFHDKAEEMTPMTATPDRAKPTMSISTTPDTVSLVTYVMLLLVASK